MIISFYNAPKDQPKKTVSSVTFPTLGTGAVMMEVSVMRMAVQNDTVHSR